MSEEKQVWRVARVNPYNLEIVLNLLVAEGYHVFKILEHSPSDVTVVAFHQVELAKKLATAQMLQVMQQAGEEALKNALAAKEKQ